MIQKSAEIVFLTEYGQPIYTSTGVGQTRRIVGDYLPLGNVGYNFPSQNYVYTVSGFTVTATHFNGGNYLFCDGHVKFVSSNDPSWNTNAAANNGNSYSNTALDNDWYPNQGF